MSATIFWDEQRAAAARWKRGTTVLPAAAREPAPYVGTDGTAGSALYEFCLPPAYAGHNLLPEVRESALTLFRELGIPWHAGVGDGPSNHLLSSQVQCVNALMPMVTDPGRVARAFGAVLDIAEVLPIEPGRFLTFEFIGPTDFFNESPGRPRVRGAHCTSVDAAFRYRTSLGRIELALVEWKYVEEYGWRRSPDPVKDGIRRARYFAAWSDPTGPVRDDLLPFEDILEEPFYQLVRQQLLAHELERARVLDADAVRVVHVHPGANDAYQQSLVRASQRGLGRTVDDVWSRLLRRSDRFVVLDPDAFLDPDVTSAEYVWRYAPDSAFSNDDLFALTDANSEDTLAFQLFENLDGAVHLDSGDGVVVWMGDTYEDFAYPLRVSDLLAVAARMEAAEDERLAALR